MQLPTPILAHGEGILGFYAIGTFFVGGVIGLIQGFQRHHFLYMLTVAVVFATFGFYLIGGWGLFSCAALPLAYWYGRYDPNRRG